MVSATVIYDSDCGFCKACLSILLAWDRLPVSRSGGERGRPSPPDLQVGWGRSAAPGALRPPHCGALRPVALGTPEADRLLANLTPEERATSWHLIDESGRRHSAGAGLAPALRLLPGGRIAAAVFARFPCATERGYRWVAGHRTLLGRFVPARARRWADGVITRTLDP